MGESKDSEDLVHVEEKVTDVARKVIESQNADDAFFVCDLRDLEAKIKLWREEIPRVTPFYAIKACSDPVILQILNTHGVNFDCSNKAEMMSVFDMGVTANRIVYANTVKCTSHLRFAQQRGVTLITFDSAEELEKIDDPNARLLLRIAANEYGVQQSMNAKYGIPFHDARNVLSAARDMELNVVGVSFHVGCAYKHPEIFALTIADARTVFDIGIEMGFAMTVLDIGGGFPGGVRKKDHFYKVCEAVRSAIDQFFPASSGVEIIGEPGQFFVTSAYTLLTKVVGKKTKELVIDGLTHTHQNVYINESKYNCIPRDLYPFMDISYRPLDPPYERPLEVLTTLWGATCNPMDCILSKVPFFEVSVEEWLLMDNMGAYTLVLACGFNGFPMPEVHYICTAEIAPQLRRTIDAMVVRSGYGHLQQAVKWHRMRNSLSHKA
ncbi:ornithine decarboxylase-like [Dermacentor silvarum]|uniref:ornithine decarboxylase-like n=1 Tax=Dermacentor silvarum TaxID=543639 RepID=UPI00189A7058|nr:ornithine decarboxylase-like [Dermacentor silvarum]